jgi:hypothetical protein
MNHGKIMATGKPEMIGVQGEDGTRRAGYSRRARSHQRQICQTNLLIFGRFWMKFQV